MEPERVDVRGVRGAEGAGRIVALVAQAAQQAAGQALAVLAGGPALLDPVQGQRHAHQTGDEEAHGGEGQPRVDGVGGLIGGFPDGGVGLRLTRSLREARAEQVAVDGVEPPAEEVGPGGEDALAEQGLNAEHHGEQQGDPQRPAQDDLAVVRFPGGFEEPDADEAEGEQVEGERAERGLIDCLPAFRGRHAEPSGVDEHEADEPADQGRGKQYPLKKRNFRPEVGPEHEQDADPDEGHDGRKKRCFHKNSSPVMFVRSGDRKRR